MSSTSDLTTPPNAAPMMTPMARSMALPLSANSLNSLSMAGPSSGSGKVFGSAARGPMLAAERRFDRLQRLEVLLETVDVGLDVGDRRAELRGRADRAAGPSRLLHRLVAELAELRLRGSLRERAAEEAGREHAGEQHRPEHFDHESLLGGRGDAPGGRIAQGAGADQTSARPPDALTTSRTGPRGGRSRPRAGDRGAPARWPRRRRRRSGVYGHRPRPPSGAPPRSGGGQRARS